MTRAEIAFDADLQWISFQREPTELSKFGPQSLRSGAIVRSWAVPPLRTPTVRVAAGVRLSHFALDAIDVGFQWLTKALDDRSI